jgi:uncharacterized membrane protein
MSTKSNKSRSLVKAFTWRFTATIDTFIISYLVIWQSDFSAFETAGLIAGFEILTKITLYYIHERIWSSIIWGRVPK